MKGKKSKKNSVWMRNGEEKAHGISKRITTGASSELKKRRRQKEGKKTAEPSRYKIPKRHEQVNASHISTRKCRKLQRPTDHLGNYWQSSPTIPPNVPSYDLRLRRFVWSTLHTYYVPILNALRTFINLTLLLKNINLTLVMNILRSFDNRYIDLWKLLVI